MEFSEFAKKLKPIIDAESTPGVFVRTLFDAVVDADGKSVFEEYKDGTFKSYYYGHTSIKQFAKKIYRHLDVDEFAEFIECCPESANADLVVEFGSDLQDITNENAPLKLSECFASIIERAAQCKRGKNMKLEEKVDSGEPILETDPIYDEPEAEETVPASPRLTINMNGEHSKIISNCGTVNIYD